MIHHVRWLSCPVLGQIEFQDHFPKLTQVYLNNLGTKLSQHGWLWAHWSVIVAPGKTVKLDKRCLSYQDQLGFLQWCWINKHFWTLNPTPPEQDTYHLLLQIRLNLLILERRISHWPLKHRLMILKEYFLFLKISKAFKRAKWSLWREIGGRTFKGFIWF